MHDQQTHNYDTSSLGSLQKVCFFLSVCCQKDITSTRILVIKWLCCIVRFPKTQDIPLRFLLKTLHVASDQFIWIKYLYCSELSLLVGGNSLTLGDLLQLDVAVIKAFLCTYQMIWYQSKKILDSDYESVSSQYSSNQTKPWDEKKVKP